MSLHHTDDAAFDRAAREAHVRSLDELSPRVQAQLALRRRGALSGATPHRPRRLLPWAGAATAGIALTLVLQLGPPAAVAPADGMASGVTELGAASAQRLAVVETEATVADLSEDPDFYLWLGEPSAGVE